MLLSTIFIVDELQHLDCLPWRESAQSVLRFADELIVVHGGKCQADGSQPTWDYFQSLQDPRVKLLRFPWPEDFDWRQIARSCTYGHLHATGQWCMRVLADEVFEDGFVRVRDILEQAPESQRMVLVERLYMLGSEYAYPFDINLIFRNDKTLGFGTVNPAQGEAAMPILFDGPIETDLWYEGGRVIPIRDDSILRDPRGAERLLAGETPRGYRPPELRDYRRAPLGVFNVDVNYFPDSGIIAQKETSQGGYERLPPEYGRRRICKGDEVLAALSGKIRSMIADGRLRRVAIPAPLSRFQERHASERSVVRRVCEEYGLSWDPNAMRPSPLRRLITITARQALCRWRKRILDSLRVITGRRR